MAKFGLPGGWRTRQPNQPAGTAPGNPLTQKLKGAWVASSSALNVNAVKGSGVGDLSAVGGATPFYSAKGVGYELNGTSQYLTNTSNTAVTSLPATFFIYAWIDNGGTNQRLFDISTGTTADDVIGIQVVNTGNIAAQHYDGATNATAEFSSSGLTGKWTSIAAVFESLTSRKLYLNGVLVASNASTVIAPVGVNRVTIGFAPWASAEYFDGKVIAPQLFGRALNAAEILSLHNNPWQTLKPRKRELYVNVAGGVTAAITGQSIALAQGSVAAAITAPLTGQVVPLALGTVAAGVSAALTGQAASTAIGGVSPVVTAALTGQSVPLAVGTVTVAGGVSAAITGQSLALAIGSVSPVVSVALTGQGVPLSLGTMVPAFERAITGQGLSLAIGNLSAAVAPALTGQPVTVSVGSVGVGGNVTRALTGQGLTVSLGNVVASSSQLWTDKPLSSDSWANGSLSGGTWTNSPLSGGTWTNL